MKMLSTYLAHKNAAEEDQSSMESLQSVDKAAETLSVSPWTVRAYIRQGKVRPVRIGRRVLIEPEEIRRIIEEGRSAAGTQTHKAGRV
jgi:excisionase family DNA binding protein